MNVILLMVLAILVSALPAKASESVKHVALVNGAGFCYIPVETFTFKIDKSDPLYETARDDHQRYLEELEQYVKCLDDERKQAVSEFRSSFKLFTENYGKDAVMRYSEEREDNNQ